MTINTNEQFAAAALGHLVEKVKEAREQTPTVTVFGSLSERQSEPMSAYLAASDRTGAAPEIVLLYSTCYAQSDDVIAQTFAKLSKTCDAVLVLDQIENIDAKYSDVLELTDADGRSYEAVCHPFRRLLKWRGLEYLSVIQAPHPGKSLSGAILATRAIPLGDVKLENWSHFDTASTR
jgi:hypothetical protein